MDGAQFDNLIKRLATTPLPRAAVLQGLVASTVALVGVPRVSAPQAQAKRLGNVKRVKICDCANERAASCNQIKVIKKKAKKILRRHECSYRGRCTGESGCAARAACRPANNTQGSCQAGQLCTTRAICVPGCTGRNDTRGSCPSGQRCRNGQCQGQSFQCNPGNNTQANCLAGEICNVHNTCVPGPGCVNPANRQCGGLHVCCPPGTARAGECHSTLRDC